MLALPGALVSAWGPGINLIASALGVELDEIREEFDRVVTDRTLEVACGTIEAGTCGALRTQAIGVVDGRDAIVIEHVNRMAADLAPDWPTSERDGLYRITIEGDPDIVCEMAAGDPRAREPRCDGRHRDACRERGPLRRRRTLRGSSARSTSRSPPLTTR